MAKRKYIKTKRELESIKKRKIAKKALSNEEKVANHLRGKGASCVVNTKGDCKSDVIAEWSTKTKWYIQVKSAYYVDNTPQWPSDEDIKELVRCSKKNKGTGIVALVGAKGEIDFYLTNKRIAIVPDTRLIKKKK